MQEISDQHGSVLKEHDYIGLSEVSSAKSMASSASEDNNSSSSYEDTDLRLGLGLGLALGSSNSSSITAKTEPKPEPKPAQQLPEFLAVKNGSKRGYSEAIAMTDNRFHTETGARKAPAEPEVNTVPKAQPFLPTWTASKPNVPSWHSVNLEKPVASAAAPASFTNKHQEAPERVATEDAPPPPKDRVVGWPPVRSYRRQTLAKPQEMFVKVNMDGITVGRKVDLNAYTSYEGLLLALEEMFQPSNGAQGSSQAVPGRDKHFLLSGSSDFVLTYEDKDGDWMLVGDVPWSMFVSTVKRLRITRGSEANGPAPRAPEKSKFHV